MTNLFDFNDADQQRSLDVIPANTICTLHLTIRAGGAGDGWLKRSADGNSEGLDCEFVVVDEGPYHKRKLWQLFTLRGTESRHAEAGEISRATLRAVLESARGIRPDDKSDKAQAARKVSGWQDLDQLRFMARIGVRPPRDGYQAKNTIVEVITPERQTWKQPPQIDAAKTDSYATASTTTAPPANAIARPQWAG
jgi:hypothetical protein